MNTNIYRVTLQQNRSSMILDQIIVSNLRNVHKVAARTMVDFMKPEEKKQTNIKYNNYPGLPVEI